MYISAPRKKTTITDTNGVKTSRLKKPGVVGKAATPAAALPSKRSWTLALSLAGNSEVGAEHTCLASVYWNEWPELALDLTSAKPIASAVELEFELDEFWYAAAERQSWPINTVSKIPKARCSETVRPFVTRLPVGMSRRSWRLR